jgi:cell division protein FtsI (penicillin-binding protein 3)
MKQKKRASAKTSRAAKQAPACAPQKRHRWRVRLLFAVVCLPFGLLGARLVMLQLDPDLRFSEEELFHIREVFIDRPRGDILDRNGRVLATNQNAPSLSVNPDNVDDPAKLAQWLTPRLGGDIDDIYERVTRKDADGDPMKFVWLKRRMTSAEARRLGDLSDAPDRDALQLQDEPVRYYPEGDLAAHVLGFANREGVGAEGIEGRFNRHLMSKEGRRVSRMDRRGNLMGFRTSVFVPPSGGDDVRLTIDAELQFRLEQELDRALKDNEAKRAKGILMDPDTGAILAMAARPAFDPNHYMDYDAALRRNAAIIDTFEPGSSFKIVTAAAALEHSLITPSDPIDCMGGRFNPYGHTIRDTHPMRVASFRQCFASSSNIAIIKVAALLGEERLEMWIHRFGFGQPTGIELPGEEPGIFRPLSQWSRLSMGSLPMGQEVSVNMIQLARAFSVIANNGYLVKPHLVNEIRATDGALRWQFSPEASERIISASTAATMRDLCHEVVINEDGTGSKAAIPEYRVGGKTGTAQIADRVNGGYLKGKYTAVFAGFAPVADPRLTCVIVVEEPDVRLHFGGSVCGPVFQRIVKDALVRMHVPADPMTPGTYKGDAPMSPEVHERYELALLEPLDDGSALDGLELLGSHEDDTEGGPGLPDFAGMTKREAKSLAVSLGIAVDAQGAGRVLRQEPVAGTPLEDVRQCTLVFTNGFGHGHGD